MKSITNTRFKHPPLPFHKWIAKWALLCFCDLKSSFSFTMWGSGWGIRLNKFLKNV
ncbi:hypothetical protein Hanom_Chr03g00274171 [Helianthus anomalus]